MTLPTIPITDDSPISGIPTSESAAAEENRIMCLQVMEMWDTWENGREPPSPIPGFPELFPRSGGTSNVPISHPNTPLGHPTISAHFVGTPSETPQFEFTTGQEKTTKTPKQEEIAKKMRSMEQSLKNIQGLSGQKSVSYADSCMFPHVNLPLGFKTPKFEKYDGHGDPIAHLKKYCNKLRGAGGKEELLMAYFGESPYNIDIAPDRNSLTNLNKKSSESFREYTVKWREQAFRVKPPMDEVEMVTVFLQAQEADYFQNMMSAMGKPFAESIKIGEMVENGLKTG
ncbi:uncharacterized protein [Nicotiana sylvestris]|uniref:uncharacterized protein n=1 Tax=Nicotiana sylvestris TaxID=4096 RepID=UPI00388C416C